MQVHKVLRAFTNTTSGSVVNAAPEIDCDSLTVPKVSCRLWNSHSSKSSTGWKAPIVAKFWKLSRASSLSELKGREKNATERKIDVIQE